LLRGAEKNPPNLCQNIFGQNDLEQLCELLKLKLSSVKKEIQNWYKEDEGKKYGAEEITVPLGKSL